MRNSKQCHVRSSTCGLYRSELGSQEKLTNGSRPSARDQSDIERSQFKLPSDGLILQPVGYFPPFWRAFHIEERSQKNKKTTRGAEKHEAVFRDSGCTGKDRLRGAWGSTKLGSSLIEPEDARVTYCSEQTVYPQIQLKWIRRCTATSASTVDVASTVACPHYHGFSCQFPLNFKRELGVIVNVSRSRMSSASFVQRHTSDSRRNKSLKNKMLRV